MVIHVVRQGTANVGDHRLDRDNMRPGRLLGPQVGVQQVSAMIINRCDHIPLGLRLWRPEVDRGIVLHQFTNIVREDFPVVRLLPLLGLINPVFFARAMMVGNETVTWCFVSRTSLR